MADEIQIRVEEAGARKIVRVEGGVTIGTAGQMRDTLLEIARCGAPLLLELGGVTQIDLSGMQLMCSVHRTLKKCSPGSESGSLKIGEKSPAMLRAAAQAGYLMSSSVCPYRERNECLWS